MSGVYRPPHGDECPICREQAREYLKHHPGVASQERAALGVAAGLAALIMAIVLIAAAFTSTAESAAVPEGWPPPEPTVEELIVDAAGRYGVSAPLMLRVAWCEQTIGRFAVAGWRLEYTGGGAPEWTIKRDQQ